MPEETHATTGGSEHAEKPSILKPEPGLAIWTVITFAILLVVLKKLAWTPILEALDKRETAIREALAEAEKARAAALVSIEEQQRLLAEARREAQEFAQRARADADRAKEDLMARARIESERLVETGRQAIEHEKRAAMQEIRSVAVELALGASAKLLRTNLDDAKNREIVSGYVRELEGQAGRPGLS